MLLSWAQINEYINAVLSPYVSRKCCLLIKWFDIACVFVKINAHVTYPLSIHYCVVASSLSCMFPAGTSIYLLLDGRASFLPSFTNLSITWMAVSIAQGYDLGARPESIISVLAIRMYLWTRRGAQLRLSVVISTYVNYLWHLLQGQQSECCVIKLKLVDTEGKDVESQPTIPYRRCVRRTIC